MAQPQIHIGTPEIVARGERTRWQIQASGPGVPDLIWYEVPTEFAHMLTDRADPALVALLIPALLRGAEIVVDGPVTDELAFWYPDNQALHEAIGFGHAGTLTCATQLPAASKATGVATGFSAGIDAFTTLAQNFLDDTVPETQRLTHLLFNNVGSHGPGEAGNRLAASRLTHLAKVADGLGLPLIDVLTNLTEIDHGGASYMASHTPLNASVAHLLSPAIGTWLYASAYDYRYIGTDNGAETAFVDPIALPLMSTKAISLRASGTAMTRVEKTRLVADMPLAWKYLDVCYRGMGSKQCLDCPKCRRTAMTLDVLGKLDRFSDRFDLAYWEQIRFYHLARVIIRRERPFDAEIYELMLDTGYITAKQAYWIAFRRGARLVEARVRVASAQAQRALMGFQPWLKQVTQRWFPSSMGRDDG